MTTYREGTDPDRPPSGESKYVEPAAVEVVQHPYVSPSHVFDLREELLTQFQGFRLRVEEIERLKNYEDPIYLSPEEKKAGLDVRMGITAELIENVKSAVTTNMPKVLGKPLRKGQLAEENSSKREKFWGRFVWSLNKPSPVLSELSDAQFGLGLGVLKAGFVPWPATERQRNKGEKDEDYRERTKALKQLWGPPFKTVTVHPLSIVYVTGEGNIPTEIIEESYKSKRTLLKKYGMNDERELLARLSMSSGQPTERAQALPTGLNTAAMIKTTEYLSEDCYQVYLDDRLVHEDEQPRVKYLFAFGRTSSSKDPDKIALGVAEAMRHIEPILNRTVTRMTEAAELLVRKRLAIELPDGAVEENPPTGEDNNPETVDYIFTAEKSRVLPPGARVHDPFEGAQHVYQGMPLINLLLQVAGEHGIAPIFKGMPPGAAGSGYRDNSLYLMARSQFQYIVFSFEECLGDLIRWLEHCLVNYVKETIYIDEFELSPKDIEDWPLEWHVTVDPYLPQNIIAEGQFYANLQEKGHITKRMFLEKGLKEPQPDEIIYEQLLEKIQDGLTPILVQDVLQSIGVGPQEPSGLVGPDGRPLPPSNGAVNPMNPGMSASPGGAQMALTEMSRGGSAPRGGSPGGGNPPYEPGSLEA